MVYSRWHFGVFTVAATVSVMRRFPLVKPLKFSFQITYFFHVNIDVSFKGITYVIVKRNKKWQINRAVTSVSSKITKS